MSNNITSTLCKIRYINLHVRGNTVQASASYECGRLSATVHCSSYSHILYLYAYMTPQTYHHIEGELSMSAYNNRTSRKAVYSANITLTGTHRLNIMNSTSTSTSTPPDLYTIPNNDLCEFFVKAITLQNWQQPLVKTSRGNLQDFSKHVGSLYDGLVAKGVLGSDFVSPVLELEETHSVSSSLRPSTIFKSTQLELNPSFLVLSGAEWVQMLFQQQQQQQQEQGQEQGQQQQSHLPYANMEA